MGQILAVSHRGCLQKTTFGVISFISLPTISSSSYLLGSTGSQMQFISQQRFPIFVVGFSTLLSADPSEQRHFSLHFMESATLAFATTALDHILPPSQVFENMFYSLFTIVFPSQDFGEVTVPIVYGRRMLVASGGFSVDTSANNQILSFLILSWGKIGRLLSWRARRSHI